MGKSQTDFLNSHWLVGGGPVGAALVLSAFIFTHPGSVMLPTHSLMFQVRQTEGSAVTVRVAGISFKQTCYSCQHLAAAAQMALPSSRKRLSFSSITLLQFSQFSSVAQSRLTLCDTMNHKTPVPPSITNSQSSPKLMCIESEMPSRHLILCRSLLLLPPIPPSITVLSN